ncbi:unnamed protein product [Gadus morhua 'NCC']
MTMVINGSINVWFELCTNAVMNGTQCIGTNVDSTVPQCPPEGGTFTEREVVRLLLGPPTLGFNTAAMAETVQREPGLKFIQFNTELDSGLKGRPAARSFPI